MRLITQLYFTVSKIYFFYNAVFKLALFLLFLNQLYCKIFKKIDATGLYFILGAKHEF